MIKKKFAFIMMGPGHDPETEKACFESDRIITYIYTVRNFEEAEKKVLELQEDGVGAIELCGAFGKEKAAKLAELVKNRMAVGYVVHEPEQNKLFDAFFGN